MTASTKSLGSIITAKWINFWLKKPSQESNKCSRVANACILREPKAQKTLTVTKPTAQSLGWWSRFCNWCDQNNKKIGEDYVRRTGKDSIFPWLTDLMGVTVNGVKPRKASESIGASCIGVDYDMYQKYQQAKAQVAEA